MVVCNNCKAVVAEGKFCEKCGATLEGASRVEEANNQSAQAGGLVCPNCGHNNAGGKFCEKCGTPLVSGTVRQSSNSSIGGAFSGFLNKVNSSVNKAATDLMAIKSDFANGIVVYKVHKIPNIQEKKVKIENGEIVFYNNGAGFTKHNQTFTTQDNDFICFYIRSNTTIQNSFNIDINAPIKNLDEENTINAKAIFNMELAVEDVDLFFNSLTSIRQDTWKTLDVNSMLSSTLNNILNENVINMIRSDGNLDLRDIKGQINKFVEQIGILINNEVSKYGLTVSLFKLFNVETNVQEINKILINNLYKNFEG